VELAMDPADQATCGWPRCCGDGQEAPALPGLALEGGVLPGADWPPDCWLPRPSRFP
jgi:hypothetical protein